MDAWSNSGMRPLRIRTKHQQATPLLVLLSFFVVVAFFFQIPFTFFALLFLSRCKIAVTQTRGHIAGSSPSSPLRLVPLILSREDLQPFLQSSTRFFFCANNFKISPRWDSNSKTNAVTGGHGSQDPRCTQKPSSFFFSKSKSKSHLGGIRTPGPTL